MTKPLFFDTDCFSSFLWVKREDILLQLFPGQIILPQEVFSELSNPSIPHIAGKVAALQAAGDISTRQIMVDSDEYTLYHQMAIAPPREAVVIGKGEAAALALAKVNGGVVASNNLKDIRKYLGKYHLESLTTGGIMVAALRAGVIDENAGNQIWSKMLSKRRLLPTATFSDYLTAAE